MRSLRDLNTATAKVEETNYNSDAGSDYLNYLQNSPLALVEYTCLPQCLRDLELQVTAESRRLQLHEGCFLLPLSGYIGSVCVYICQQYE